MDVGRLLVALDFPFPPFQDIPLLFAQFLCDTGTISVLHRSSGDEPCNVQVAQERDGTREKQEFSLCQTGLRHRKQLAKDT